MILGKTPCTRSNVNSDTSNNFIHFRNLGPIEQQRNKDLECIWEGISYKNACRHSDEEPKTCVPTNSLPKIGCFVNKFSKCDRRKYDVCGNRKGGSVEESLSVSQCLYDRKSNTRLAAEEVSDGYKRGGRSVRWYGLNNDRKSKYGEEEWQFDNYGNGRGELRFSTQSWRDYLFENNRCYTGTCTGPSNFIGRSRIPFGVVESVEFKNENRLWTANSSSCFFDIYECFGFLRIPVQVSGQLEAYPRWIFTGIFVFFLPMELRSFHCSPASSRPFTHVHASAWDDDSPTPSR